MTLPMVWCPKHNVHDIFEKLKVYLEQTGVSLLASTLAILLWFLQRLTTELVVPVAVESAPHAKIDRNGWCLLFKRTIDSTLLQHNIPRYVYTLMKMGVISKKSCWKFEQTKVCDEKRTKRKIIVNEKMLCGGCMQSTNEMYHQDSICTSAKQNFEVTGESACGDIDDENALVHNLSSFAEPELNNVLPTCYMVLWSQRGV